MKDKRPIYKVFRLFGDKKFPYAKIYDNGTFQCIDELASEKERAETEDEWRFNLERYQPPMFLFELDGYCNREYPDAFSSLVLITGTTPPYKRKTGYAVDYLGRGAPWERDESGAIP